MSDFKGLVEEMKAFYGVSSLEAVAEKMGYEKNTAIGWRNNKKLSAHAQLKWLEAKSGGNHDMSFEQLVEEMKDFYGVGSLDAIAEKLGYERTNAAVWRKNKKFSARALLKWLEAKQNKIINMDELNIDNTKNTEREAHIHELNAAKQALGVQTDKELAEILGVETTSINSYRVRGIPQKLRALIAEKRLEIESQSMKKVETMSMDLNAAKQALGVQTDKELAEILGVGITSINNYRIRGIPQKLRALIAEKRLENQKEEVSMDKTNIETNEQELGVMKPSEFRELRTSIGWTQERLAQELGITARQISAYENGGTAIKLAVERKLRRIILEVSAGDKQLFADKKGGNMEASSAFVTANYYPDISVSAGYGRAVGELESTVITIPVGILGNITGLDLKKSYDALRVYGDSMLPYIKDGEIALIERTEQASNGDVVIANIGDDLYIKYLERHPLGKWVKLRSHNKEYSDIELVGDEVEMLRIVGVLRATISVKVF